MQTGLFLRPRSTERRGRLALSALALIAAGALAALPLPARSADAWIGTWAASPQPVWDADFFAPTRIPRLLRD